MRTFENVNFCRDGGTVGRLARVVARVAQLGRPDEQRAHGHVRFGEVLALLRPIAAELDHLFVVVFNVKKGQCP